MSDKCKLKPHWDITPPLSEWLSSISQQTTSVSEDVEKREPSCMVGGNTDCWSHYRNSVEVPQKIKNGTALGPSKIPLLGIYLKKPETLI